MCWINITGDIMNIISNKKKGTKKLLHVRKDIFIFAIRMNQLIKIGLGAQK